MKVKGNTVLITGGATGIGFALAEAFTKKGNEVIICGRRASKLKEAEGKLPKLHTRVCDVSSSKQRESLFKGIKANHPSTNILINNAGIQRMIDMKKGIRNVLAGENEVETDFIAPVELSAWFIPLLMKKKEAAIINVTSGLGFVPIAAMPVYCAVKAALHSFTQSLRYQLKDTSVKVFEIIPPMVDTDLGKGEFEEDEGEYRGIPPSEVARATMAALEKNEYSILIGEAVNLVQMALTDPEQAFLNINQW